MTFRSLGFMLVLAPSLLHCGSTEREVGKPASGGGAGMDTGSGGMGGAGVTGGAAGTGGIGGSPGSGGDGGSAGGPARTPPPSCEGLAQSCGPNANEYCCESPLVTGGTFNRSNDARYPATVGNFQLDKYEVTVGRFRKFIAAWADGWRPAEGAGKHTHLSDGEGLLGTSGVHEGGWNTEWSRDIASVASEWDEDLSACYGDTNTWTTAAGANETLPVNCINWFESYAFCIWDGGFLPSEAEWNYAAAGGNQQRQYPWSVPASSTAIDDTVAVYCGNSCTPQKVGSKPDGNGLYGQADLAGNMLEVTLDSNNIDYVTPCINCAHLTSGPGGVVRGGRFDASDPELLLTSYRAAAPPLDRDDCCASRGVRCARSP